MRTLSDAAEPSPRALDRRVGADPTYWLAMLAASALGTNLGDFWVDTLFANRLSSLCSLVIICGVAMLLDRAYAARSAIPYWVAVLALRAAATNVADGLTHDFGLSYPICSVVLGALSLAAATLTRPASAGQVPRVDGRYWLAMLLAGLFGTVAGDMVAHSIGLPAASVGFCAGLAAVIALRARIAPASMLLYWCIILVERCAGTAVGDLLASRRGLALGLPVAMACTGGAFALVLAARARAFAPAAGLRTAGSPNFHN